MDNLEKLNAEVDAIMGALGFDVWSQGGGFTAWGKTLLKGDDSPYVLISFGGECCHHFDSTDFINDDFSVCLNVYDAKGVPMTPTHGEQYFSWDTFKNNFGGKK